MVEEKKKKIILYINYYYKQQAEVMLVVIEGSYRPPLLMLKYGTADFGNLSNSEGDPQNYTTESRKNITRHYSILGRKM